MSTAPLTASEVDELAVRFEERTPQELLAWAADRFGDRIVLTCSWQFQSSVLVHMLHELGATVRIVELDTGLLFPETHATREALIERYGITVDTIRPQRTVDEQALDEGPELWTRQPDRCCELRKVLPLMRALDGMDAWITGIRREQSPTRANARPVELDETRGVVKIQPLVTWSVEDVMGYLYAHDVPFNELHTRGYRSIGCMPCTQAVLDGDDERSGRWAGTDKIECGLHLPAQAVPESAPDTPS
ncbi:MAG: phosphoadenylyl-sulfate reductase [Actinobacteria bacterium]|nr:phosphoadenylyl-sulfate reductase [Thermoleophilia bacterium]MCB9011829.1 phosphoadenylyl-sulfate reductase [Actinomycetota bacterium]